MLNFVILLSAISGTLSAAVPQGLKPQLEGRIVEGHPTSITSFPYQISLQRRGFHSCGGTITSERIVVTAAHCLQNVKVEDLRVRAGSSQWMAGGVLVFVKAFKNHERYVPLLTLNDIAIIRLNASLTFSSTIQPINLPKLGPKSGAIGIVSGWGTTKFGSDSSPTQLKYVILNILTYEECSSRDYNYGKIIRKGMICTYDVGKDSCQGDSGGPLVSENELVGVVSWGNGCGFEDYPGVYTNVALMNEWVNKTVTELENLP